MALQLLGHPRPPHHAGKYRRMWSVHRQTDLLVVKIIEGPRLLWTLRIADQRTEGEPVSPLVGLKDDVLVDKLDCGPDGYGGE